MARVAGIDIGSNTIRLLIAEIDSNGMLIIVESQQEIIRLGQGMGRDAVLQPDAMQRALQALGAFQERITARRPDVIRAVATSAVRGSRNRHEFVRRVKMETGLTISVISGHEEAQLTLLGASRGLVQAGVPVSSSCLLIDIGGGSTEYVSGCAGDVAVSVSTMLGVVRMTEQVIHHDPPLAGELAQARDQIDRELTTVTEQIGQLPENAALIGTAGTITTIAALSSGLARYEPSRVHGMALSIETVDEWVERFAGQTIAQRRGLPVMEAGRADVIVVGSLILQASMRRWQRDTIVVSDWGLREGVALSAAAQ